MRVDKDGRPQPEFEPTVGMVVIGVIWLAFFLVIGLASTCSCGPS